MKFLVNPAGGKRTMAAKPKRNAKGQFVKGRRGATRKRRTTPTRKAAPRRRNAARSTYRRNPARPDVVKMLTRGTLTATQVLLGKAGTRAIPDLMNLPQGGNTGLAVQIATALGLGYISEMFFSKATAAAVLAGGLTAPVETLLLQANIPYVSQYLSPTAAAPVAGYVPQGRALAGYVPESPGLGIHGGDYHQRDYPAMWT